ncbi:SGNH/GDSL hydrolase family protein [Microbacterium sp. ProA8]|jgi:lysophospholipase L1-like esterase|uniref:SGNH/GDSL hydrolase family protein n=1 Tax=Microbacterium chionoecetis TaxID=3153754 RepID=UPI0032666E0E
MKRRIVAALAAIVLGATALFGGASAATADGHVGAPYVAIGDSEAAGTGNMPYVDEDCRRSAKAYPVLVGDAVGAPVMSAACAGATTSDVLGQAVLLGQTGVLGPATELVTITAGVNNVGWQTVLPACSSAGTPEACAAAKAAAIAAIPGIVPAIAQLVGLVRTLAPGAAIVVTGYPPMFGTVTEMCSVGSSGGAPVKFTPQLAAEVNAGIDGINAAVAGGVSAYQAAFTAQFGAPDPGVEYADVTTAFDGHSLCDTGERWISGLSSGKGTVHRGFHPNAAGQQAYASAVMAALAG